MTKIAHLIVLLAFINSCGIDETTTTQGRVLLVRGLTNGLTTISGSPDVSGLTDSLDLTPFDSIQITFTTSFNVFPPQHFEDPYTVLLRRGESPNNLFYFVWPQQATQTHEIKLRATEFTHRENTSFEIHASSNAPVGDVLASISEVTVYGWHL